VQNRGFTTEDTPGANYEFVDSSVSENTSYEYRLDSVDMQSLSTYRDSATITVPQNNTTPPFEAISVVFLPFIRR
jgi:hypothetical protein